MDFIKKYDNNEIDLKRHLHRVGDIINFEGPVLSLFQDERNKDLYIFDWVDSDDKSNRWLVYKAIAELLNQFLLRKITYKDFFERAIEDNIIYYTDIENNEKIEYSIYRIKYVPEIYLPDKEAYFDANDSIGLSNIFKVVGDNLQKRDDAIISLNKIAFFIDFDKGILEPADEEDYIPHAIFGEVINVNKESKQLEEQQKQNGRESNRISRRQAMDLY